MTINVDPRAGSRELVAPLRALGLPVAEVVLGSGDLELVGNGPDGVPLLVGVEYKTIEDAAQCMRNGRFAEQARRMREDFQVRWLLLEGRMRSVGRHLQVRKGEKWKEVHAGVTYQELAAWILTMAQAGGMLIWRTETREESVEWIRLFYNWWTAKAWEDHRAHLEWYRPPIAVGNPFAGEPPLVQKVAAVLPHLGTVKAKRAATHFRSVAKMCCAPSAEWTTIEGVGPKIAAAVTAAILKEE